MKLSESRARSPATTARESSMRWGRQENSFEFENFEQFRASCPENSSGITLNYRRRIEAGWHKYCLSLCSLLGRASTQLFRKELFPSSVSQSFRFLARTKRACEGARRKFMSNAGPDGWTWKSKFDRIRLLSARTLQTSAVYEHFSFARNDTVIAWPLPECSSFRRFCPPRRPYLWFRGNNYRRFCCLQTPCEWNTMIFSVIWDAQGKEGCKLHEEIKYKGRA